MEPMHATTILAVRHQGKAAIGGDGQVTLGQVVMKNDARKVRRLYEGKVLVGFAGSSAITGAARAKASSRTSRPGRVMRAPSRGCVIDPRGRVL